MLDQPQFFAFGKHVGWYPFFMDDQKIRIGDDRIKLVERMNFMNRRVEVAEKFRKLWDRLNRSGVVRFEILYPLAAVILAKANAQQHVADIVPYNNVEMRLVHWLFRWLIH